MASIPRVDSSNCIARFWQAHKKSLFSAGYALAVLALVGSGFSLLECHSFLMNHSFVLKDFYDVSAVGVLGLMGTCYFGWKLGDCSKKSLKELIALERHQGDLPARFVARPIEGKPDLFMLVGTQLPGSTFIPIEKQVEDLSGPAFVYGEEKVPEPERVERLPGGGVRILDRYGKEVVRAEPASVEDGFDVVEGGGAEEHVYRGVAMRWERDSNPPEHVLEERVEVPNIMDILNDFDEYRPLLSAVKDVLPLNIENIMRNIAPLLKVGIRKAYKLRGMVKKLLSCKTEVKQYSIFSLFKYFNSVNNPKVPGETLFGMLIREIVAMEKVGPVVDEIVEQVRFFKTRGTKISRADYAKINPIVIYLFTDVSLTVDQRIKLSDAKNDIESMMDESI
jgi:hypothetical protein